MNLLQEGAIAFEARDVFYNPRMKLNRDISVSMARTLRISDYLDAQAASGIRGLRVAKEAEVEKVTLNDVSPQAYQCILRNIVLNGAINCSAVCCNANVLMHMRHFEAVDLDPFGSPSSFLAAAARSVRSYLFITATDTAPLCGAHLKSGVRMYLASPIKTDYHKEMGARILLGLVARELARQDKGMYPLLTYAIEHYVRVYLRIERGAKVADECLDHLGYVEHCQSCGCFKALRGIQSEGSCMICGSNTSLAGPLWLGRIHEPCVIDESLAHLPANGRASKLLETCVFEAEAPFYYDHHSICAHLRITPSRIDRVIDLLREQGWKATRTHFSGIGIKTDATIRDVEAAASIASSSHNL
jgi:tRNA (guanine26-N2/guanine27-N2)-dimethyltransferase